MTENKSLADFLPDKNRSYSREFNNEGSNTLISEEKVVKELSQPPLENTVIEQELLNEERTDSDTKE